MAHYRIEAVEVLQTFRDVEDLCMCTRAGLFLLSAHSPGEVAYQGQTLRGAHCYFLAVQVGFYVAAFLKRANEPSVALESIKMEPGEGQDIWMIQSGPNDGFARKSLSYR